MGAIIWGRDPALGNAFDYLVMAMILLSLTAFTFETLPTLTPFASEVLGVVELATIVFFTIEYGLRLWTAEDRRAYALGPWGIIDLIAFAPYWLALGIDLRAARMLRLVRLVRLLKLLRYARALDRLTKALSDVKEELIVFGVFACAVLYLSAVGIYFFENEAQPQVFSSIPQSLWWSLVTLTTVGYGDIYPVTVGGRFFTFIVLMVGLGVVAVPTGLISAALQEIRREEAEEQKARDD
ncbi:MAG TPA: ion transporter [Herpetosiphonaceae bacterium]|nr:ion transporter [Herpetosiphonaceae bacterium]